MHQDEFEALFNTILINVTSFFRDPDVWDTSTRVLPHSSSDRTPIADPRLERGMRLGPGSLQLAMLLAERSGSTSFRERVKIYATDVDNEALTQARHATYPRGRWRMSRRRC